MNIFEDNRKTVDHALEAFFNCLSALGLRNSRAARKEHCGYKMFMAHLDSHKCFFLATDFQLAAT